MAAPQFGQLAAGWLIVGRKIGPVDPPDADSAGRELALQARAEVPIRAGPATKDVETKRMILGKSVAGKVRFRQQADAGNASGTRKLMPGGVGYGMERERRRQLIKE